MSTVEHSLRTIVAKAMVAHTVTYTLVGWLASWLLNYEVWFAQSALASFMRPVTDPQVMAGPLWQPLRGVLFGLVFYLLRDAFLGRERGWLTMWFVLMVLGVVNVFGPAPGSIEGFVYTTLPLTDQLRGLPEIVVQGLLLSVIVFYWMNRPGVRWASWALHVAFALCVSLPLLGLWVTGGKS